MLWLNFLHIYQPPTLEKDLLLRITQEAYLNIIKILKNNPRHKLTLNITACLTEYLHQVGSHKLIKDIKLLVNRGQVELTGTAAFHPLLPLIPLKEVERQIKVNTEINRRHFGAAYAPRGFYLPEMAYSAKVGRAIKRAGFSWIILDEISLDGRINNDHLDSTRKYKIKGIGLNVIFRNRKISRTYVPDSIHQLLGQDDPPSVVVSATDGELYGHKYIDRAKIISKILKNKNLVTATISEFLKSIKQQTKVDLIPSSWESTPAELAKKIPYSLWQHPLNKIHQKLWQLADFALNLNYRYAQNPNHFASRLHLEKGLASCTFWWASDKDFKLFDDPAWSPEEVEKGALELLSSVRALYNLPARHKIKAEKMFLDIHKLIWIKHWIKVNRQKKA